MEQFIQNILEGVRQWVNGKLEDLSFVISSHINELTKRMTTAETKLKTVEENAQVNKIESITVNGQTATVTDKAATVTIPEATQSASGVMSAADKTKLDGIATGAQVNIIEKVKVGGVALEVDSTDKSVNIPAATVTGVDTNDKIISLDGTLLKSNLSITIENQSNVDYIVLKGKDDAEVSKVDASTFVKDGMLSAAGFYRYHAATTDPATDARWEKVSGDDITIAADAYTAAVDGHEYIVLNWNADSAKSNKFTFIDALGLVDDYTAGTGLTLSDRTFTLNAAGTTATTIGGVYVEAKETSGLTLGSDGKLSIVGPSVEQVVALLNAEETSAPAA